MTDSYILNLFILLLVISCSSSTWAAVVGRHPDTVRKPLQREGGTIHSPSFLLFRRTYDTGIDDINHGQQIGSRSEAQNSEEDGESRSFMMIRTSTFSRNPFGGSDGIDGDNDSSSGVFSIDMTIIQFDEPNPDESRKVPGRFGSKRPLSIESVPSQQNKTPENDQKAESKKASESEETPAAKATQNWQKLWENLNTSGTQFPWSVSGDKAPSKKSTTTTADKPQVAKSVKPTSFDSPDKKQMFFGSSTTFDNTSHHSQL